MYRILPERENPVLRQVAQALSPQDIASPRVQRLIAEMKTLLAKEEYGVALAAPQVGESVRLFIVSGRALARGSRNAPDESSETLTEEDNVDVVPDQIYINPTLTKLSRKKTDKHEGCLSVRGKWGEVPRAEKATVQALDETGRKITRGASGFLAHIFQHEMDHLEGILYTDKATHVYDDDDDTHHAEA